MIKNTIKSEHKDILIYNPVDYALTHCNGEIDRLKDLLKSEYGFTDEDIDYYVE